MRTVRDLLEVAVRQLNVREDPPESNNVRYNTWYYGREVHGKAYPWCMVFVQWCFAQVDVGLPVRTASCSALMNAAKGAGCWVTRSFLPGDVVIYDFTGKKQQASHCGIVESVTGSGVIAIEGNTSAGNDANGGQVQRRTRPGKYIMGAVRPGFDKEEPEMTQEEFNKKFEAALSAHRQKLQDNDASSYSAEARAWAVACGLIQGSGKLPDGSDNYMWEDLLTREQMATLLYRFALLMGQA